MISAAPFFGTVLSRPQNVLQLDDSLLPDRLWRARRGGAENRGTGAATTIPSLRSYSDFTCAQAMDRDYLACLAWLAWPSWCDTGGPPSPASSRAQPVPRGPTAWSNALSGLNGPSDITTRLSLFDCTAGAVFTPAHTFILSIFHSLALRHEAKLCSVTGPNTI